MRSAGALSNITEQHTYQVEAWLPKSGKGRWREGKRVQEREVGGREGSRRKVEREVDGREGAEKEHNQNEH